VVFNKGSRGPEQRITMIFRSQPMRPVPITAMKIAEGAIVNEMSKPPAQMGTKSIPAYAAL